MAATIGRMSIRLRAAGGACKLFTKKILQRPLLSAPAVSMPSPALVLQTWKHFHCHHGSTLRCSRTDPGMPVHGQPEYIPKRKAKNPMMKVGLAWIIGLPSGIITFLLAKREVDKNRLKQLKIRQRMKAANEGDYDSERYKTAQKTQ
ncbi:uncharacterized protein [Lepisosteus oculatus]|uniref:uncharacterized protein n=1 Tax=Lepisosteus oculatus TaxID=7918 RepID=UPI0035F5007F